MEKKSKRRVCIINSYLYKQKVFMYVYKRKYLCKSIQTCGIIGWHPSLVELHFTMRMYSFFQNPLKHLVKKKKPLLESKPPFSNLANQFPLPFSPDFTPLKNTPSAKPNLSPKWYFKGNWINQSKRDQQRASMTFARFLCNFPLYQRR